MFCFVVFILFQSSLEKGIEKKKMENSLEDQAPACPFSSLSWPGAAQFPLPAAQQAAAQPGSRRAPFPFPSLADSWALPLLSLRRGTQRAALFFFLRAVAELDSVVLPA
jgi:hypothetical protein